MSKAPNNQSGFVLPAVIAGLVLLSALVGIWSRINNDSGAQIFNEQYRVDAATLLRQSDKIAEAIVRADYDHASLASITDLVTQGYLTELPVMSIQGASPGSIVAIGYGQNSVAGVGTAAADTHFGISGIPQRVCERLNSILYGGNAVPDSADAVWQSGAPVLVSAGWPGRTRGCVRNLDGVDYLFYSVAVIR